MQQTQQGQRAHLQAESVGLPALIVVDWVSLLKNGGTVLAAALLCFVDHKHGDMRQEPCSVFYSHSVHACDTACAPSPAGSGLSAHYVSQCMV
jgi:hypothetical protein